ncbi:MAG TPA: response regulator transcription factor [Verrucomicrobiota bacterium]|nr:two-component system response regulator [Verrucomicrobiales bacterium]HRI15502.1 response regulator transcription factor [Verrucomicrobiota bacterium]
MKCLIADDDPRIRQLLISLLERPGWEFLEAACGLEALALYEAHGPDLVIMDIEMSPMDGITAIRAMRQRHALCKVLMVSQHNSSRFRQAAAAVGAIGYVLKDDLHGVIEALAQHLPSPVSDGGEESPSSIVAFSENKAFGEKGDRRLREFEPNQ